MLLLQKWGPGTWRLKFKKYIIFPHPQPPPHPGKKNISESFKPALHFLDNHIFSAKWSRAVVLNRRYRDLKITSPGLRTVWKLKMYQKLHKNLVFHNKKTEKNLVPRLLTSKQIFDGAVDFRSQCSGTWIRKGWEIRRHSNNTWHSRGGSTKCHVNFFAL